MTCLSRTILFFLVFCSSIQGQAIFYASSILDNSLDCWTLYDSTESFLGELESSGLYNDAFNSWNFRIGETSGSIKRRWKENLDEYNCYQNNNILSFNPVWKGQYDQWKIITDSISYNLELGINSDGLFGILKDNSNTKILSISNDIPFDPRDLSIEYFPSPSDNSIILTIVFIIANYSQKIAR